MSIILGIDPGTTTVGFAVLRIQHPVPEILDFGVISTTPKIPLHEKLVEICADIAELCETYHPERCGIETLLFTTNVKTGIAVAQARGAIITEIAKRKVPLFEFGPMQVKKSVCGNGHAPKSQVQNALKMIFKLDEIPKPDDAADAIAIAYAASLSKHVPTGLAK